MHFRGMDTKRASFQFPGLNALRFFAALVIIFHHLEQFKFWMGLPNAWGSTFVDQLGKQSVAFFFVLSGLLVTLQLLNEAERTMDINWRRFQTGRAIRLWPVYFLVVLLSIGVLPALIHRTGLPDHVDWKISALYVFMIPNLGRLFPPVIGVYQFWYIGVQEQFYLFWPKAVAYFKKRLVPVILWLLILKFTVQLLLQVVNGSHPGISQLLRVWELFQIEQILIGALGAWAIWQKQLFWKELILNAYVFALSILTFGMFFVVPIDFTGATLIQGVALLILILNLSLRPGLAAYLERPFFDLLGNLSFGMYAYHTLVIALVIFLLDLVQFPIGTFFPYVLGVLSIGVTLVVSLLSYRYFESYFLTLKKRMSQPRALAEASAR